MIAEEVELINPSLVTHDDGLPAGIHYSKFISPILNELQRHEFNINIMADDVEILKEKIVNLESEIALLKAV